MRIYLKQNNKIYFSLFFLLIELIDVKEQRNKEHLSTIEIISQYTSRLVHSRSLSLVFFSCNCLHTSFPFQLNVLYERKSTTVRSLHRPICLFIFLFLRFFLFFSFFIKFTIRILSFFSFFFLYIANLACTHIAPTLLMVVIDWLG